MSQVVNKKDIKDILKDIEGNRGKGGNPYLIYKSFKSETGLSKIKFTIKGQPEFTKKGENDVLGNLWSNKWTKVEMKIKADSSGVKDDELKERLDAIKVLELGGANKGKPTGALFKALAINFDRNDLDFDDIVGTKWSLDKNEESGWYEIEYLGIDDEEEEDDDDEEPDEVEEKPKKKPKKKKKSKKKPKKAKKVSGNLAEVKEIVEGLSEEPEFEEAVAKDKFITAIALRGSVSMDDVEECLDELEEQEIIEIDEDDDVVIL